MAEQELKESKVKQSKELVVQNISDKRICLENGILFPGDKGVATVQELQNFSAYLKKV